MDLILSHKVHRQVVNGIAQVLESTVGTVSSINDVLGLGFWQLFKQFLLVGLFVLFFRRKVTLHGPDKTPCAMSNMIQVSLTLCRRNSSTVIVRVGHADKVPSMVDIHSPILSGFVPALVRRAGTKNCKVKSNTNKAIVSKWSQVETIESHAEYITNPIDKYTSTVHTKQESK